MATKPHTVLKLESHRDHLHILWESVLVVCEDGSAYRHTIGSEEQEWQALPPVPGTAAAAGLAEG